MPIMSGMLNRKGIRHAHARTVSRLKYENSKKTTSEASKYPNLVLAITILHSILLYLEGAASKYSIHWSEALRPSQSLERVARSTIARGRESRSGHRWVNIRSARSVWPTSLKRFSWGGRAQFDLPPCPKQDFQADGSNSRWRIS